MPTLNAFQESVKNGDLAAVRAALVEDPSLLNQKNESGQTAYLLACYYRKPDVAEYLLGLNPELDLFTACVAGHTADVVKWMETDPALLESHSGDGWTPLHLSAFFGHKELAEALLAQGAQVDSRSTNSMQNTPLHAATAGRQVELMKLLLEHGADADATQEGGWTALHAAAQNGDRAMIEVLLASNASINVRAGNNQSPLDLALLKGHHEVAALLEQLGAKLS
ncbi:MAG: ankyrin repeat domain-containing protein [Bryobacteraceae bacterium]